MPVKVQKPWIHFPPKAWNCTFIIRCPACKWTEAQEWFPKEFSRTCTRDISTSSWTSGKSLFETLSPIMLKAALSKGQVWGLEKKVETSDIRGEPLQRKACGGSFCCNYPYQDLYKQTPPLFCCLAGIWLFFRHVTELVSHIGKPYFKKRRARYFPSREVYLVCWLQRSYFLNMWSIRAVPKFLPLTVKSLGAPPFLVS